MLELQRRLVAPRPKRRRRHLGRRLPSGRQGDGQGDRLCRIRSVGVVVGVVVVVVVVRIKVGVWARR